MGKRRRHENLEEHENHERWLVSYADFITLLFAFFVVMYSVSSINEGKYRILSDVLGSAFRSHAHTPTIRVGSFTLSAPDSEILGLQLPNSIAPNLQPLPTAFTRPSPLPAVDRSTAVLHPPPPTRVKLEDLSSEGKAQADPLEEVIKRLRKALHGLIRADLVAVRRNRLWVEVEIKNNVLFHSGSAEVNERALEPLNTLATILQDIPNRIQVEGFTDNVPISTPVFPSNWELSAARAASVVHVLMKSGVRPERMAAVGYGEYRPIADNATEEGRNRNRRVVLVILGDMGIRREIQLDPQSVAENASVDGAESSLEKTPISN